MKLAHTAVVTPGRCGLYETTRELVVALRALGVDSRICDPTSETVHDEDRGARMASMAWARKADIVVNHSGLGPDLEKTGQPIVHVDHGHPRSTSLIEMGGGTPLYRYHYHKNKDSLDPGRTPPHSIPVNFTGYPRGCGWIKQNRRPERRT